MSSGSKFIVDWLIFASDGLEDNNDNPKDRRRHKNNNHRKGSNLKNKRIKIRNGNVPEARDENKDAPQFDQQLSLYVDNYEGTNFEKGKY
uniref:Uncharacterized protein n=1 Tax=Tetranychus urticae TaxID=32264 RepID=T1L2H1_TETUR